MKTYRSTLVMAVLVAAVAGFAFFEYKKGESDEAKKAQEDRVFPEADSNFTHIRIGTDKVAFVEVDKENSIWQMKEPVKDLADDSAIDSLVGDIASQKAKTLDTEGIAPKWVEYGLDPDQARHVDLATATTKYSLLVSLKPAFDGSSFIRFNDKLMLGSTAWTRIIGKNATDLRNKRFLPAPLNITNLKIETAGKKPVVLKKEKDRWQFASGEKFPLDESKVDGYISDLKALRALDFVSEDQNKKAMGDAGLVQPKIKVSVDLETKDPSHVDIRVGERKGTADLFVATSYRPQIYKVAKTAAEKLVQTADDFRDRKQPFQFDLEQVKGVNVETSLAKIQIRKEGSQWSLAQPEKGQQLDADRLQDLFGKVKNLEADAFVSGGKGLKPAKNLIVFTGEGGKEIFKLAWGEEFKQGKDTAPLYYTQTSNSKDVLGVKTGSLMTLPLQTLVKAVEPPAAPSTAVAPAKMPKAVTQ